MDKPKESLMNNKHGQQLEALVTELGTATELTQGNQVGNRYEGLQRGYYMGRSEACQETKSQVTELGTATNLTLGQEGNIFEGSLFRPVRF